MREAPVDRRLHLALALACLLAAAAALLATSPPPAAAGGPGHDRPERGRTERLIRSTAPDAKIVLQSYVRIWAPLPDSAEPHPKACDYLGYLRYRHARGPRRPQRARAILIAMPGFLGGAASFDQVARNTVRNAARKGRFVEFWALDRRANCLEDLRGLHAEARARDASVGFDYYFGNRAVGGKRFGGFTAPEDAQFMKNFGLARTMRDWYRVMLRIRGQRRRAHKFICGGHSLGGPLTAAFASWDFDGNAQTTRDAGRRQCAGFFGLDTGLSLNAFTPGSSGGGTVSALVAASGGAPFINAPPLTPRTIQTLTLMGPVAHFLPGQESEVNQLIPDTPEFDLTLRILYSKDAAGFATGDPDVRQVRLDNASVLGGVLDDNSAAISILRAGLGTITGGDLADKNFPAPDPTLALPTEENGPLYRWHQYRRVGNPVPPPLNDAGDPYTSRESETSSLRELARVLFQGPSNFVEQYFPTRLLTDVAAGTPEDYPAMRYNGIGGKPGLLVQAGDSDSNENEDTGRPQRTPGPNNNPLSREITIPGYNHLDVATAARRQNDGRPEASAQTLANFTLAAIRAANRRR